MLDFGLRLVDEIVRQNREMMKFEVDEITPKTVISLKFPVDRRKVVHYQPIDELTSSTHEFKSTLERLSSLEEIKRGKRFSNILNRAGS